MALGSFIVLTLSGPNFLNSANEIIRDINGGKITRLSVSGIEGKEVAELHTALVTLREHFHSFATIQVSGQTPVSAETIKMMESASGVKVLPPIVGFSFPIITQNSIQQAPSIVPMTRSETVKNQTPSWQIFSGLQTNINKTTQAITVNKQKSAEKLMSKMLSYIGGTSY